MNELINDMKMCPLCFENSNYSEINARLHRNKGFHSTKGITWKPEKGHPDYELHKRISK